MIDEKKIEEAANKYLLGVFNKNVIGDASFQEYTRAFKTGINWFLENLWHDASEVPTHDSIFVEYKNGFYGVTTFMIFDKLVDVTRWLYIEDLMKGGK